MIRKWDAVAALVCSALLLGGCWDAIPIEELAYVSSIGLDLGQAPGTIALSLAIVNPVLAQSPGSTAGGGGGGSAQAPYYVLTTEGTTVGEALQLASEETPRRIFLGEVQAVVFGRTLAQQGVGRVLDDLWRIPEMRPAVLTFAAVGSAKEVLEAGSVLEPLPHNTFLGLAQQPIAAAVEGVRLSDVQDYLTEPGIDPAMPLVGVDCAHASAIPAKAGVLTCSGGAAPEVQEVGTALFDGDRLVNTLTGAGSEPLRWLMSSRAGSDVAVTLPSGLLWVRIEQVSHRLRVLDEPGGLRVLLELSVEAVLRGVEPQGPVMTESLLRSWQDDVAAQVQTSVAATLRRTLADRVDPLGIGWWVEENLPAVWGTVRADWRSELPRLDAAVRVQVQIRNVGLVR